MAGNFLNALGSFAVAAQVLFVVIIAFGAYLFGFGMNQAQRSALALGYLFTQWRCHVCGLHNLSSSGSKCSGNASFGSSGSGNCVVDFGPLFCLKGG